MKKTIVLLIILLMSITLVAQERKKNTVYIIAAPSGVIYDYRGNVDGGGLYDGNMSYAVGLEYSRELFRNFELLTGVHYANNKIDYESSSSSGPQFPVVKSAFHLNYISVPVQVKYYLTNFFFLNGGGIVNFSIKEGHSDAVNRIGLVFGLGGKIDVKDNYRIVVNPFFQMNDLSSQRSMNFYNLGAKIGLGYKF